MSGVLSVEITGLDADLFRRCIQNVPFDENKAVQTLHNLQMFLGLDTYAPYLVDPPVSELGTIYISLRRGGA
jgi:hypothetical protein